MIPTLINLIKWSGIAALLFLASALSLAYAVGVPKPPAIRTENIGRVGWGPLLHNLTWFDRYRSKTFAAWMPDGTGILVKASSGPMEARLHVLRGPGERLELVRQLPRNARIVGGDPGDPYLIAAWDNGGDEQFRLHAWTLDDRDPVPITPPGEQSHFGASEPDGSRIAYTSNRRNGRDFDVYVVDPLDPSTDRRVANLQGAWAVADWSVAPGRLLLVKATANTANQLFVLDLGSGELEAITDPGAHYSSAQWSYDGGALYYASNRGTEFEYLRRLDLTSMRETVLSDAIRWDVSSIQEAGDGSLLIVEVNENGRSQYYLTDATGSSFDPMDLGLAGQIVPSLHPDRPVAAVTHADERGIGRVYSHIFPTAETTLWVGQAPASTSLAPARLIQYPTFDHVDGERRTIPAFVYPGAGEGPHPVTISVHGGPEAQARLSTTWGSAQRRGVTVITPNVRGSTGYGRSYEKLDNGLLREDAVRDIGALLDWIDTQSDLDSDRVSIVGGSYGGYMVLASLVHYSDRIQCGVDRVGVSNFVTFLENTADYRRDLRRAEYGDERIPEMRDFLNSISPLTNAESITSRLMVVQGANDPRVPVTESLQLVERVSGNGGPIHYMEAADEGHGFRKPWNTLYAFAVEQRMLAECLELD